MEGNTPQARLALALRGPRCVLGRQPTSLWWRRPPQPPSPPLGPCLMPGMGRPGARGSVTTQSQRNLPPHGGPACPSSHSCEGWKSQNPLPASVAPITGHREVDGFTQHKIMLLPSGSQKVQNQFQRTEGQVSSGLAPSAAASLGPGPRSASSTYPSLWGQSSPCFPLTGTRVVLVRASWITWGYRPPGDP